MSIAAGGSRWHPDVSALVGTVRVHHDCATVFLLAHGLKIAGDGGLVSMAVQPPPKCERLVRVARGARNELQKPP